MLSTIIGLAFSVVAFGTLVAGEASTIITIHNADVINTRNEFFGAWDVEIGQGQKSSILSFKIPTNKELPENMQVKLVLEMNGQDPMEFEGDFCDALVDPTFGQSFTDAGVPNGQFPKECPFVAGDFAVSEWEPPGDMVPSAVPEGPFKGTLTIMEEGKDACVQIDFDGELSKEAPE